MNPLAPWRRELRGLIPKGFLRRDQGEGLFVSDYPRFGEGETTKRLRSAGYAVDVADGLAHIDGTAEKYRALLSSLPPAHPEPTDDTLFLYALARRLERSKAPFSPEAIPVIRAALKYADAGDRTGLYAFLSPAAALAQRRKTPLPAETGRIALLQVGGRRES